MDAFRCSLPSDVASDQTKDRLCAIGQYQALETGQALPADAHEDLLVFVSSGAAKLTARSTPITPAKSKAATDSAHCNHVLAFHFAGDIVSVLRRTGGDFSLIALNPTDLVVFSASQFLDVAQDDPVVIRSVLTRSLQFLHRSRTRMMQLGYKSARQRLAGFLLSMAKRLCGCTQGECEFSLPMSRRDIADSLGLTIETVSRQFAELREAGLVTTKGRSGVRLTDMAALAIEAGLESSIQIQSEV